MAASFWLFVFTNYLLLRCSFAANAAYDKRVKANPSCGENETELYYHISQARLLPFKRTISKCDQNNSSFAHPPEAIVDERFTTFWQAKGGEDKATITIDLSGLYQKFYYVNSITISFGDYYRPQDIALYKKSSSSGTFEPWHYLVTEGEECETLFGVAFSTSGPHSRDEVLCTSYGRGALETNENVTIELEGGRGTIVVNGDLNTELLDWMNTTEVELRFFGLRLYPDRLAKRWQHYVVREVKVEAHCHCNGHGDGINCPYNTTTKDRECVCQEGTCGIQCGYCCPAYNQYPYEIGKLGPFKKDKDNACEKCNCHGHSDVCVYNQTVANNVCSYDNNATNDECSMDIFGKYSGGGVCIDCKDDTEGTNCQRCVMGHWRKERKSQWDKDACQPCNCFVNGTSNKTRDGVGYLDCVRDIEEAATFGDLAPGQCLCKNKTTGLRCDRCVDGYYNLTAENPEGCLACLCTTEGAVNASISCTDYGVCSCKERVIGNKCSECKNGTFNLADQNQYGCTECMCSGITENCTSTSLYRSQTKYDLQGWNLTQGGIDSNDVLRVINIQEEMNGQSVDLISANVTTEGILYWRTEHGYFKESSLVTSYGGFLKFTRKVSFLENATLHKTLHVIIQGPRNITIETSLPGLNSTVQSPVVVSVKMVEVSVKMVEFDWRRYSTNITVDRKTFMLVLSKPERMWITASYFATGNGLYQTSFGNLQISSVSNTSNGNSLALDVEQCVCGEEYQGLSCERCARGYHRINVEGHPFFGQCISCNCHGHTEDCDPDTGRCLDCQHNTTGFNCTKCRDGFYGNARNGTEKDCQKCPCEPPKTTTDLCVMLPNGSAQCLNCSQGYEKNLKCDRCELGYYGRPFLEGGNCSLCQCNNNTDICDRETGNCQTYCENNSTGWHCERCENGTYGDATVQQCQACTCDTTGSYDVPCNFTSGQCHCKRNVRGLNCSECEVNTYGFSNTGCLECNCNEFGSTSLQCNDSGICTCKNHTHGDKCDMCEDYYYGLPNATCQDCACNVTGSNNTICDHVSGMCSCKLGVTGRQCDQCQVQHKDFSNTGCEPCPACTMKLQGIVDDATRKLMTSKDEADQADKSIDYYADLEKLDGKIERVQRLSEHHADVIGRLEEYRKTFTNTSINSTIIALEKRDQNLQIQAKELNSNLSSQTVRVQDISNKTKSSSDFATHVKLQTENIVGELENLVNESKAKNMSSTTSVDFLKRSIAEATSGTERGNSLTQEVDQLFNKTNTAEMNVKNQTEDIENLSNMLERFDVELNRTRIQIEKDILRVNTTHDDIDEVERMINKTNSTIQKTSAKLSRTSFYINESVTYMADGETNYKNIKDTKLPELNRELESLKSEMNQVNSSYMTTKELVGNASRVADKLTAEAEQLQRNFSAAKAHGEKAVESIDEYEKTTDTINRAVKLSMEASKSVNEAIERIQNLTMTNQSVTTRALECRNASVNLLAKTKSRNINISEYSDRISQSFQVFTAANETCSMVETQASIFENKRRTIIAVAASEEPAIANLVRNTTEYVDKTQNISDKIELETIEVRKRLLKANNTLATVNELVANSSRLLDKTHFTGNETEKLLANISLSVNRTKQIKRENEVMEQYLLNMTTILEQKLKAAKDKVAKFRLAMNVQGNTSVQYRPTPRMISNPLLNIISLDFKTNRSSGLLLYMSPSANNTHQSISLKLVINRVRFTYNVGSSPVVITNWEVEVEENVWYRVYATRYGNNARLTVTNLANNYSRTYEGPSERSYEDSEMKFNKNSSVFLGGLPLNEKANFSERYFDGDLDNLVLNEDKVSLWEPLSVEGVRRYAAKRRVSKDNSGYCDTFHGNGFVKQRAGDFATRMNSSLSFQFRTFFKDSLMVLVEGNDKEFIYSVSLNNGRVIFHYNNTRLASSNSDYNDGRWYEVSVSRTLKNASLHVALVETGSERRYDYVNHSSRMPMYLPTAQYVYFGGTNETRDRFAGGMKYVWLHSMVQNKKARRNLNDANFTVESSGVAFDECLLQVEKGLRYSNGYSAVNTENITSMTSLEIRFKTREPSGLLVYGVKENVHFYLALFHGNLFIVYANATSSSEQPLQTWTETLNDGAYHTITIQMNNSRIQTKGIKDEPLSRDVHPDLPTPVPLGNLYIAGIPSSVAIPLEIPVLSSLTGDVKHVRINGQTVFDGSSASVFTSAVSVGVSAAGVSPQVKVAPTALPTNTPAPPTCGAKYPEKVRSEKHDEIHFLGIDSVLTLNVNRSIINNMAVSFVISIEFRALSPNGVLFMAANNQTSQFVSIELVDGKLIYQFNTGSGLVRMKTTGVYTVGGVWYKVDVLRIGNFGAMVVRQTKEYHKNDLNATASREMNINNVFVGGVNNGDVDTSVLENPEAPSFFGCIREVEIQTQSPSQKFNLSGDSIPHKTRNIQPGQCYDYVQPQVGFNGAGYAKLNDTYDLSSSSELTMRFRTTQRNGLLFYAASQNGSSKMILKEVHGQMVLSYVQNNILTTTLRWIDPAISLPENENNSYALCNNIYHTVNVKRYNGGIEMNVDRGSRLRANITDDGFNATIYLGGVPSGLHGNTDVNGFVGCIESVQINKRVVDFRHETSEKESMEFGCGAPIRPQQSYAGLNIFRVVL